MRLKATSVKAWAEGSLSEVIIEIGRHKYGEEWPYVVSDRWGALRFRRFSARMYRTLSPTFVLGCDIRLWLASTVSHYSYLREFHG